MKLYYKKFLFFTFLLLLGVGFFVSASAQSGVGADIISSNQMMGGEIGLASTDIRVTIAKIIRVALGLLGIVALGLTLYGGFIYMTAGGDEGKISQAKKILINGVIGMAIIMSSYAIVTFVMNKLVEATGVTDDGGGGGGGGGDDDTDPFNSNRFYVSSLPPAMHLCVRNAKLAVVFNKEVDLATIPGNIVVRKVSDNSVATGTWSYSVNQNTIIYTPTGSCAPSPGNDCFEVDTNYSLVFTGANNIRTLNKDPELTLSCIFGAHCGPVNFQSGSAVDRTPPTVTIIAPGNNTSESLGATVPVQIDYTDDNGLQNLSLFATNPSNQTALIRSVNEQQCKKTGTINTTWPTAFLTAGNYRLAAVGLDFAGMSASSSVNVTLRPNHCFNGILETDLGEQQAGPPDCGGVCGSCGGGSCSNDNDCAGGTCVEGVCQNVMRITGYSPSSGAPGTYVSIYGYFFGTSTGRVYFSRVNSPNVDNASDWIEAQGVTCAAGSNWTQTQIIVQVPTGTVSSTPIKVQKPGATPEVDTTANRSIPNFLVNTTVRPGICSISPSQGKAGDTVTVTGKNFGTMAGNDSLFFADLKATILRDSNNNLAWSNSSITASVNAVNTGFVGAKVTKNGVDSNSVRFNILPGASNSSPIIDSVSPNQGAEGEYITITGKNFGRTQGVVLFKTSQSSGAISGNFLFPKECQDNVWTDNKILVKAPTGSSGTNYYIQVQNSESGKTSAFDTNDVFRMQSGTPSPGICDMSPISGPIPFPEGQTIDIYGDYFITNSSDVYFWTTAATNPTLRDGRTPATRSTQDVNLLKVVPSNNTVTGPVSVYQSRDNLISNYVNFEVKDCTAKGNSCSEGYHCCTGGNQKGACLLNGDTCSGEIRSTGFVWRFSTKDIPPVPKVVERCGALTESGDNPLLPSPSPSIQWESGSNDSRNVCNTAAITVEFNTELAPSSVNSNSVRVYRCSSYGNGICNDPNLVTMDNGSYNLRLASGSFSDTHQYLSLTPAGGIKWASSTWYQVVLGNSIRSDDPDFTLNLSPDRPCGENTAYCFAFKTGTEDCRLKKVIVTPTSYFTSLLEEPISRQKTNTTTEPVYYFANGLSEQRCILMNVNSIDWMWRSQNTAYATINGPSTNISAKVNSLSNTVGVGLPNNAVNIEAIGRLTTSAGSENKSGFSPLTINLSDPKVVDFWPSCQEACTNAEVGVKFNLNLSTRNLLNSGTVKLLRCNDENCISTTEVGSAGDLVLDNETIKIANANPGSDQLEPNTLYKVVVSSSSTEPNMIWSRSQLNDPNSSGKAYNQEFSYRFKTKEERCSASRVVVEPSIFEAEFVTDRKVYSVQPYTSPDQCSKSGQKLNAWQYNWTWASSDANVASTFSVNTRGKNPFCTNTCIRRGSTISFTTKTVTGVCGNGTIEAGEDCENPSLASGCGLDCRWLGTTAPTCGNGNIDPGEACDPKHATSSIGCSNSCLKLGSNSYTDASDTSSSLCGNKLVGSGEDCDTGILAAVDSPSSSLSCSSRCLHLGTKISSGWCLTHLNDRGGFTPEKFKAACSLSVSRCGDGVTSPDEDPGCDTGSGTKSPSCNDRCLLTDEDQQECTILEEGCDKNGQNAGSSLFYETPSSCGDGTVGIGEDAFCETNLIVDHDGLTDPWALTVGVGAGTASGNPAAQRTNVSAQSGSGTGSGEYVISCGYQTDAQCSSVGANYGVGKDSCCYARTRLVDTDPTYPLNGAVSVCLNTALEANFVAPSEKIYIDPATLNGNYLIAKGSFVPCPEGETDVGDLISFNNEAVPWYERIVKAVVNFVSKIFGSEVVAQAQLPTYWCVGSDLGNAKVVRTSENTSKVEVSLSKPLAPQTYYAIILKEGIKDTRGVSIGNNNGSSISWNFMTGTDLCEIESVNVNPTEWYFSKANVALTLTAQAISSAGMIQPVPGVYSWDFEWKPGDSPYVAVQNTAASSNVIVSKNKNGEVDVRASARIIDNKISSVTGIIATGKSRIVVNLCENSWPPKEVVIGGTPFNVFPYGDEPGNYDGFNLVTNAFDTTSIPPSSAAPGVTMAGDGYFNFSTYYCADDGASGKADDLPFLRPTVQSSMVDLQVSRGTCEETGDTCSANSECGVKFDANIDFVAPLGTTNVCGTVTAASSTQYYLNPNGDPIVCSNDASCSDQSYLAWVDSKDGSRRCLSVSALKSKELTCYKSTPFKRFIFTNDQNSDAIGIQVFPNPKHLSPEEWFKRDKSMGGQGFLGEVQTLNIGGYKAVSNGSNIYIGALNYSTGNETLYDVIYLFSINQNATNPTKKVFEKLMENLRFNTNVPKNEGYCGTGSMPLYEVKCDSDLDCPSGQTCFNQISKLQRNYQRLQDLKEIDYSLQSFADLNNLIACSHTYSAWGACQSDNTQTRVVLESTPAGCDGSPITLRNCTYTAPSCTYSYTPWGNCQANNTQTRVVISSSPNGCTGSPSLSQFCTYTPPPCTSFVYSDWGVCQPNGTQTRTVESFGPAGCSGGNPVLSQSCTYSPSACNYTYSAWGACQANGRQTRTLLTSEPAGCTGTPTLSQACDYSPTCTYTYSDWGTCQSNSTQTRTVLSSSPAGCSGTPDTSQSCTYGGTPCTYTYSDWGTCQMDGTRSRTVLSSSPSGCSGTPVTTSFCIAPCTYTYSAWSTCQAGNVQTRTVEDEQPAGCNGTPVTSQPCPTCTDFTYSAWGACQPDGTQTRTVLTSGPFGCSGGTPVTTQSCTYVAPTCTYQYSAWGACQPGDFQTRTVITSSPAGCAGTPVLTQPCTYVVTPTYPTITLWPSSRSVSTMEGEAYGAVNYTITNTGSGTLNWSATDDKTWCSVSPSSGILGASQVATISVNLAALSVTADRTYTCTVTISDTNATNNPQQLTVNYTIYDDPFVFECFAKGTKVLTPSGDLAIENLKAGDAVLSFDENSGEIVESKVVSNVEHLDDHYYLINGKIKVTEGHRFAVMVNGFLEWVHVKDLVIGNKLINSKGEEISIKSINRYSALIPVYNPSLTWPHTYYVSDGTQWILVHNMKP